MRRLAVLFVAAAACAIAADERLLKLVMPDARIVSGINITQLKNTAFGRFLLAQYSASEDPGFDQFVRASGFDPRQNLDEILFASPGGAAGQRRLVLARGAFAPGRIADLARSAGARITPFQGVDIIEKAGPSGPHGMPISLAFLDDSTAILGNLEDVRGAIERRSAGARLDATIAKKAQALSAVTDAWFVSMVPVSELAQRLPSGNVSGALQGDALKTIDEASGGIVFGDLVKFSAELVAHSADDATSLATVLRFLAGLVQTGQAQNQGAPPALPLDKLDLKAEGNLVRLALAIPEPQLEALIRQAK